MLTEPRGDSMAAVSSAVVITPLLADERVSGASRSPRLPAPAFASPVQSLLDDVAADGKALAQLLLGQPGAGRITVVQTKVGEQDTPILARGGRAPAAVP